MENQLINKCRSETKLKLRKIKLNQRPFTKGLKNITPLKHAL